MILASKTRDEHVHFVQPQQQLTAGVLHLIYPRLDYLYGLYNLTHMLQ